MNDHNVAIDVRCPTGSSLLLRVLSTGETSIEKVDTNLLQLFCKDCTREFRKIRGTEAIQRVLHVFTTEGEFIRTEIQFRDGAEKRINLATQAQLLELNSRFRRGLQ